MVSSRCSRWYGYLIHGETYKCLGVICVLSLLHIVRRLTSRDPGEVFDAHAMADAVQAAAEDQAFNVLRFLDVDHCLRAVIRPGWTSSLSQFLLFF